MSEGQRPTSGRGKKAISQSDYSLIHAMVTLFYRTLKSTTIQWVTAASSNIAFKIAAKPLHIGTWLLLTAYLKSPSPYHGLYRSNKLLYKQCAKSMGRPKFRPPLLPHFSTDFNETPRKISGIRPHVQHLVDVGQREGGLRREGISVTFCVLSFFNILAHAYRSHQKTNHDHLWLKTRVSAQSRTFWGSR